MNPTTREEMKNEAINRMKLIGLKQEFIDHFANENEVTAFWSKWIKDVTPYLIEEEEDQAIEEFEKSEATMVWAVIHDLANEEGEDWDGYFMLYVSNVKERWEEERKHLMEMNPTIYYKCVSSESATINVGYDTQKIDIEGGILYGVG